MKRVTAIIGLAKNAGKTTVLNQLIKTEKTPLGVISTGRDGEEVDLVMANKKPKVLLPKNIYYSTFDYEIKNNSHKLEVIAKLPFKAIGRNLWIVKTMGDVEAEVIGPPTLFEQTKLVKRIFDLGVERIFIDGALDRRSIVTSPIVDEVILVAGASFGSLSVIVDEVEKLLLLTKIKKFKGKADIIFDSIIGYENEFMEKISEEPKSILINGAITNLTFSKIYGALKRYNTKIIVRHPVNLQISKHHLENLLANIDIYTLSKFEIAKIGLNSFSPNGKHLDSDLMRKTFKEKFPNKKIFDLYEVEGLE